MAIDDRLSDLLVDWEQGRRSGLEPTLEELCRDTPDLLPVVRESIDSLRATDWMFQSDPSESSSPSPGDSGRAALNDTELPASHLTAQEFTASIFQSGLLSRTEITELKERLEASALPGEAPEIASKLVTEGKLTRYQAAVLLKASKDPLLIDNYVILDTLDTGGMGLVFKALHRSMNRVVALKLLPASMMSARDTVKRFQREVQAAAALKHPNIVAAYDADESEDIAYLVMEYVEGTNLFRLVKDEGPRSLAQAADYVRQAARGLAYLHSRGIIHRDVKPANLILANDGTVKLLDMGLVRFASSEDLSCAEMDQELTQAGIVIGTVAYMSPEQALDTRSADQRSDIYSLGCTLFFLLTGRSLYHEETGMKTLLAHREQPVPSIREFCEEAPVSLDAVFRTMVAKRPADRLQTMEEVIAAVEACVPDRSVEHAPPKRLPAGNVRPARKPFWSRTTLLGAGAGLLAVAASAYLAVIIIRIKSHTGTAEIRVSDPSASVTVETQTDDHAKGATGSVPGAGLEKHKYGRIDLGWFQTPFVSTNLPGDSASGRFRLTLEGSPGSQLAELAAGPYRAEIFDAVNGITRQATFNDFPPGSDHFRTRLKSAINKALPRPYVRDVWLDPFTVATTSDRRVAPIPVKTATARKGDFKIYLTEEGARVAASQSVSVRSQVDGEIVKVLFNEGQTVHAGDPLFEIDQRQYRTRLDQAHAQLQQDHAALVQAKKELDLDQKLAARNAIATSALDSQIAAVARFEGAVKNADAAFENAALQLGYCHITSPITGRIGLRIVDKGNVVRAAGTTSLAVITQVQPIAVIFSISQEEVFELQGKFNSGKEVAVDVFNRNGSTKLETGKLVGIDNQMNPGGTVRLKAIIANEHNRLFPGEVVRVQVLIDTLHNVVIVPAAAVQSSENQTFVYVVKPDNTVEHRRVVVGPSQKDELVVTEGLAPGAVVAVSGFEKLMDHATVDPTSPSADFTNRGGKLPDLPPRTSGVPRSATPDKVEPQNTNGGDKQQIAAADGAARTGVASNMHDNWPTEQEVVARMDGESSDDRAIAQWVHAYHGEFANGGKNRFFVRGNDVVPKGDFHLFWISISDQPTEMDRGTLPPFSNRVPIPKVVASRLARLTELKVLQMHCRDCTDATLAAIGSLNGLNTLSLRRASITDSGLRSLSKLTHLRALDLSDTSITDIGLEVLAKNKLFGELHVEIPAKPWIRRALPVLRLDGTQTTEAGILAFQKSVSNCEISAAHLMEVRVDPFNSPDVPAPVPPAPGSEDRVWAEWLLTNLHGCSIQTDVDPETVVMAAESLPPIDFHITHIGFRGRVETAQETRVHLNALIIRRLSDLTALEAIWFDSPSEAWVPAIATLKQLKSLSLRSANDIGDDALKPIGGMTNLTGLQIESKRLTDGGLRALARLTELTSLGLGQARYLHGSGLKDLSGLKKLKTLDLADTGLVDNGLSFVAKFPALEGLNLRGTWISDAGLAQVARLSHLKSLVLGNCRRIDDAAFESLRKLKELRKLNLYATRVTVESVPEAREKLSECNILWPPAVQQQQANEGVMREVLERHRQQQTPKGQ